MRTDRGWRRFYATGWLISAGITLVAFRMWQLHVREVEEAPVCASQIQAPATATGDAWPDGAAVGQPTGARPAWWHRLCLSSFVHAEVTDSAGPALLLLAEQLIEPFGGQR